MGCSYRAAGQCYSVWQLMLVFLHPNCCVQLLLSAGDLLKNTTAPKCLVCMAHNKQRLFNKYLFVEAYSLWFCKIMRRIGTEEFLAVKQNLFKSKQQHQKVGIA